MHEIFFLVRANVFFKFWLHWLSVFCQPKGFSFLLFKYLKNQFLFWVMTSSFFLLVFFDLTWLFTFLICCFVVLRFSYGMSLVQRRCVEHNLILHSHSSRCTDMCFSPMPCVSVICCECGQWVYILYGSIKPYYCICILL